MAVGDCWSNLAPDILRRVSQLLDLPDLVAAACVCKAWKSCIDGTVAILSIRLDPEVRASYVWLAALMELCRTQLQVH